MSELALKLGFRQEHSSPYYPQANRQAEAVNKTLKMILQWIIDKNQSNWHIMLYSSLWAYRTSVKTVTGFTPFQLVYGMESIFPVECEIPSLKLAIELLPETSSPKECLVHLEHLNEQRRDAATMNEALKPSMISLSVLEYFLKATLSWSMTKIKTPWGKENSSLCGMVPL